MTLKDKHIILGITGSIAAYKAAYIIRGLVKKGVEVQVVITPAGKEFITPLTLSTLSSHPVISEFFSNRDGTWNSHVDLGLWADAMLNYLSFLQIPCIRGSGHGFGYVRSSEYPTESGALAFIR